MSHKTEYNSFVFYWQVSWCSCGISSQGMFEILWLHVYLNLFFKLLPDLRFEVIKKYYFRERCFCLAMSVGKKKKFWVPLRNRTSDLQIPHVDSEFFFSPTLCREDKKHLSLFRNQAQNLPSLLFYLQKLFWLHPFFST